MANNPYQHPQTMDDLPPEPRVSALAVCSLVFGLVCCIPGSGLLATILGGAGIIRISKAEGRLSGRAMAIIGLLLGLLSSAFWVTSAAATMYVLNQAQVFLKPVQAIESGDTAAARTSFTAAAAAKLTDERAQAFVQEVKSELGAYKSAPQGLAGWISDYMAVGPILEKANIVSNSMDTPWPIPVHFDKEMAIVVVHMDRTAGSSGRAALSNIEVLTASGKKIQLIPTAPPVSPTPAPTPSNNQPGALERPSGG